MKLHWWNRARRDACKARRRALPSLETMERREVPAGVMLGVDGVLTITATSDAQNNNATIALDAKGTSNPFDDVVVVNWSHSNLIAPTKSYPMYKLTNVKGKSQWVPNVVNIVYRGNAGIDSCINRTSISSQLYGNDGDDHLEGGSGRDWIEGGNGSDGILGNDGGDVLYASFAADFPGDSKTLPPASQDVVMGGSGDDYIYGARNGVNILRGGNDDDWVYGANFAVNRISGDDGFDYLAGGDLAFNSITEFYGVDTIHTGTGSHTSIWTNDGDAKDMIYVGKGTVAFIVCDQPTPKGDKVVYF